MERLRDMRLNASRAHLHSFALGPLLLIGVHDVGHVPGLAIFVLGFPVQQQLPRVHGSILTGRLQAQLQPCSA